LSRAPARLPLALLLLAATCRSASSAEPPPLSTIGEVRRLSPAEARQGLPVRVQGIVTYYHHDWQMLFVEDQTGGVFVYADRRNPAFPIGVGDRVEIVGRTVPGDFVPSIGRPQVRPLEAATLPRAPVKTLQEIATGAADALWIEVGGVVRSAKLVDDLLALDLMMDCGRLLVHVQEWDERTDFAALVDAEVRLAGVCTTLANESRQFVGAELWTPHLRHVQVVEPAPDPFGLPAQSIDSLRRISFAGGHQRRLKVAGTVTLVQAGRGVFLQDQADALFVSTAQALELRPGDRVEAAGFVAAGGTAPSLEDGLLRALGRGAPPVPAPVGVQQALSGGHSMRLVRVRGRFVGRLFESAAGHSGQALVLNDGDVAFAARLEPGQPQAELASLQPGSLLELSGVCAPGGGDRAGRTFEILLRSPADVVVLQQPSWWTTARVRWLLAGMTGVFALALAWAGLLRSRVRRQTAIIRRGLQSEAALEQRYRELVENVDDLVFSLDPAGRFTSVNLAAQRILGHAPAALLGRPLWELATPRARADAREMVENVAASGSRQGGELEALTAAGDEVVLELSARPRLHDGRASGIDGIARDVTQRKRAEAALRSKEEALRESEERFALAVQGTNDGIWDWDLRRDHVYFSARWKAMLGYQEHDLADDPEAWFRLVHPDELGGLQAKLALHRQGLSEQFECEHRMLHRDGSYRWVLSRGVALRDADGLAYRMAGSQADVTDRRSYDPLTKLPNRALFVERLEKAVMRASHGGRRFAVLFLDLDRFKIVNDSLGHLEGDRLLLTISQRLEACLRPGDMIARFGGDEFAVLVEGVAGVADVARVAERIRRSLAAPFKLGSHELYSSASIGIALSSSGYERAEDLLRDADTAMYRAKAGGRARFEVFDAEMRAQVTATMRTENDLRRALERSELELHYQPIVELTGQALVGWEALVRWRHPERGLLLPGEFIGVAEETGLVVALGETVLRQACRKLREWHARRPEQRHTFVCVNVSARQFSDPELVARIEDALRASGLDPAALVVEITESAIMESAAAAVDLMARIKRLGVRIHVDDFGTGYSSLSYLHRFPLDALKVDRSFVASMTCSDEARAIVRSILGLADTLKLSVIAEGIESHEQLAQLRGLGCEMGQGVLFSPALDAVSAESMLAGLGPGRVARPALPARGA
jgi:diguanylate cyclase (GGDEF)-like protein/PAS domain S-box-containing protein